MYVRSESVKVIFLCAKFLRVFNPQSKSIKLRETQLAIELQYENINALKFRVLR